jgi:hypothetical protein
VFGSACIASAAGEAAGEPPAVAGEIAGTGVVPVIGETPVVAGGTAGATVAPGTAGAAGVVCGTAGLTAAGLVVVAGGADVGGVVVGGVVVGGVVVWPNEVSARVTVQRLAISSVFIRLIPKVFPGANSAELVILFNEISASRAKLSRLSFRRLDRGGATI